MKQYCFKQMFMNRSHVSFIITICLHLEHSLKLQWFSSKKKPISYSKYDFPLSEIINSKHKASPHINIKNCFQNKTLWKKKSSSKSCHVLGAPIPAHKHCFSSSATHSATEILWPQSFYLNRCRQVLQLPFQNSHHIEGTQQHRRKKQ